MTPQDLIKEQEKLLTRKLGFALFSAIFTIATVSLFLGALRKPDYVEVRDTQSGQIFRIRKDDFDRQQKKLQSYQEREKQQRRMEMSRHGYVIDKNDKYYRRKIHNDDKEVNKLPPELRRQIEFQMRAKKQ